MNTRPLRTITAGPSFTAYPLVSHARVGTARRIGVPVMVQGLDRRARYRLELVEMPGSCCAQAR